MSGSAASKPIQLIDSILITNSGSGRYYRCTKAAVIDNIFLLLFFFYFFFFFFFFSSVQSVNRGGRGCVCKSDWQTGGLDGLDGLC